MLELIVVNILELKKCPRHVLMDLSDPITLVLDEFSSNTSVETTVTVFTNSLT